MAKAELKTKLTDNSVDKFFKGIKDSKAKSDCVKISEMMSKATKAEPKMWGTAIVGFGDVLLKYESGRELDWFQMGFSPRKQNLTLYGLGIMKSTDLLKKLGKHKTGKGCLYINSLEDIDATVLKKLMDISAKSSKENKGVKEI